MLWGHPDKTCLAAKRMLGRLSPSLAMAAPAMLRPPLGTPTRNVTS